MGRREVWTCDRCDVECVGRDPGGRPHGWHRVDARLEYSQEVYHHDLSDGGRVDLCGKCCSTVAKLFHEMLSPQTQEAT